MSTPIPTTSAGEADLEPGATVGEYVVESKIGQGGFGAVFKATHPVIGKLVALKVLARKFSSDPEIVERFVAEARAVNQIRHRNIIDIFSFGQLPDGRHYYAMEFLDGEPLDVMLERDGAMPVATALPILRAIARALDACHAKGIAHRDLKPANIFVARDPDGATYPKLLDFGIAKLMDREGDEGGAVKSKTRTGIPMGTPYYMSPEQCRGRDVDHRTDYYAFGVVAHEMLTGKLLFDGDDYMAVLMQQITEAPDLSRVPPAMSEPLAWLLQKDASARPPNLVAAMDALDASAAASGIDVPNVRDSRPIAAVSPALATTGERAPRAAIAMTEIGDAAAVKPARASRLPIILGAGAAIAAIGVVIAVLASGGGGDRAAAPPAVPVAPAAKVVPVEAAPPVAGSAAPITITVTDAPDGTEVLVRGKLVGTAPGPVQLDRGTDPVVLTLRADGYAPISKTVTPDRDQPLAAPLKKRATATAPVQAPHRPPPPPHSKDDIATPDFH